jgi:serine/threonine protein kinase
LWNTTLLGGSFHYMAPERLTEHYSQGSDLYSFGVAILEMLSGSRLPDLMRSDRLWNIPWMPPICRGW